MIFPGGQAGNCRSCGAKIIFAKMPTGRTMPLDPGSVPDGNIIANEAGLAQVVVGAHRLAPDTARYQSHFRSCPNAKEWRKS